MTDEPITDLNEKQEEKKKFNMKLLKVQLNDKLKVCIFLLLFSIFDLFFGILTPKGFGINFILILLGFGIISFIDGMYKHKIK